MKLVLVGHRGIGKTSLLGRIKKYHPKVTTICLDQEIEKKNGKPVKEIMEAKGEVYFRKLEIEILQKLTQELAVPSVIAVGAGFEGEIPSSWHVLWLQRSVDAKNFVFGNRPSLNEDGSLGLPIERFQEREERYARLADYELELTEHRSEVCMAERIFFKNLFEQSPFALGSRVFVTLRSGFSYKHLHGVGWELRDDLLEYGEMLDAIKEVTAPPLISFRNKNRTLITRTLLDEIEGEAMTDWAIEMGDCDFEPHIWSLHQRKENFLETLSVFEGKNGIQKLAVPVYNFTELRQGYEWFMKNPKNRVFLPCSENGRWQWFRQVTAQQMPYSFLREGRGTNLDQPTLLKTMKFDPHKKKWGAILGQPVNHSLTPWYQEKIFGNGLAIEMGESELSSETLSFLGRMGMNRAAVTSPLKEKAFSVIENKKDVEGLSSVNTLQLMGDKWMGANTDAVGFKKLVEDISGEKVAIWGGGGTLSSMLSELPEAAHYSSRTGELKHGEGFVPDVIIWAVGTSQFSQKGQWPPSDWQPKQVIDLNYTNDSPGIICAHRYGCQYASGLSMFTTQGKAQQEFWKNYEL